MSVDAHAEPLPQDYLAWEEDFPEQMEEEIASPRWTSRSIVGGIAIFAVVLGLGYYFDTKKWFDGSATAAMSSPAGVVSQSAESELARSLREIETLKKAASEQNGINQQMAMAIAALQSEQHGLRQQIAAMQTRPASTTGSIRPSAARSRAASKQPQQAPLNLTATRP